MGSPLSPKLLLLALLLLAAPVHHLQARKLGASQDRLHDGGLPSVLVLPSGGGSDDGDGEVFVPPPKLNALHGGVSRPGGLAPPPPRSDHRRQPGYEYDQSPDIDVSSPGVTGNQKHAPPPPAGNPPSHYRRRGPAADLLRVFRDALVHAMWLLPEQT